MSIDVGFFTIRKKVETGDDITPFDKLSKLSHQEDQILDDIDEDIIKKMLAYDNAPNNQETGKEEKIDLDDSIIVDILQFDEEIGNKEEDDIKDGDLLGTNTVEETIIETIEYSEPIIINSEDNLDPKDGAESQMEHINKKQSLYQHLLSQIENFKARWLIDEYEKKLVQAVMEFEDDVKLNYMLADYYLDNNDLKKSMSIYKKLHEINPDDDRSLYHLWLINLELGDIKSAEYLVGKAIVLKSENPRYLMSMAEIAYNLDDIMKSIDLVERAISLRPNKFDYLEIVAKLYKEAKDEWNYHKVLLKMFELDPLNIKVKNELAKIYR